MKPSQDTYPIFEANQVLSNLHLNQGFSYLDEQERLTRANLIGIGIVCGLEIGLDETAGAVSITRGCGVTSEGYLIEEPEDVTLVSFKPYTLPTEVAYPPFMKGTAQFDLWELFPAGEPGATALKDAAEFLKDKAVLLFLELKKEGLRNCSLNNCDDRGSQITITVRRLVMARTDLDLIIAAANQLPDAGFTDLEGALTARLNLPDLRLPRYDVPNGAPATTKDVLAAFQAVFGTEKLAQKMAAALTAAYNAFAPLLQKKYPSDPFADFSNKFGFLDSVPANTTQVLFLQYYYDFFDDLLGAYYEFRCKGVEMMCACCPPDQLFPRHLMLGLLHPAEVNTPGIYRNYFLPSPAAGGCEERSRDLAQLFDRLVQMIERFTDEPPLPLQPIISRTAVPVRITPSKFGCAPLSEKAIPYYYLEDGTPPLYQLWNPKKSRHHRANYNLSYRSDQYTPPAPPFVTEPLRYDLEPHNFLRIEGHLGKNYQRVLSTLLSLKSRYRLPIEVVALRTGAFDENIPVDLNTESCHFQDLEALYDTLKAQLICFLCNEVRYFYALPFESSSKITTPVKAQLPLLAQCAPDFLVQPQTLGRLFEDWLATQKVIPDIDPNIIINFLNAQNVGQNNIIIFYIIIYISKLFEELSQDLQLFDLAKFEKRYRDLVSVTDAIEREREQAVGNIEGNVNLMKWEELDDRLEDILYHCSLDVFTALAEEYQNRVRQVKQRQFLSFFLRDNPGIQHKAGVPLGGTFVIVYHAAPPPVIGVDFSRLDALTANIRATRATRAFAAPAETNALADAFTRISANRKLAIDPDIRLVLGSLTGRLPDLSELPPGSEGDKILQAAVDELADGTVVADFYLPYIYCSDCTPVQFVLPKMPPTFEIQKGCTNANGQAEVTITPDGGLAPYSIRVDDQDFKPLDGVLLLNAGQHTLVLRDAEATESLPRTVTVAAPLVLGQPQFNCVGDKNEYVANFQIAGGTAPYTADRGTVSDTNYSSDVLTGDTDIEVVITDNRGCTATQKLRNSCAPSLAFTLQVGCTTQNAAPVKILPTGGTPPYQMQLGNDAPAPIGDALSLQAGSHTITVRDAAGGVTAPQTVMIPPDLTLRESDFTCEGTASYRSVIAILGGTQPYSVNGNLVAGNVFTTDPVASGTGVSVTVMDKNNCSATIQLQHTCEQPCNLPCDGISRRCAYRMWLQAPDGAEYKSYRQASAVTLRFNNKDIQLPDAANLLQFPVNALNAGYGDVVNGGLKKLNEAINSALVAALGDAGKDRLVISPPDLAEAFPFGVFFIEHFVCDTFSIEFSYSYAKPDPAFTLTVRYTNEDPAFAGMILTNRRLNNKETRVPAFDCAQRNQCTNSGYDKLCKGAAPKPVPKFVREGNSFLFAGNVDNPADAAVTTWVWDLIVAHPNEPFYEGQEVTAQLGQPGGTVRLTAITKDGCFGRAEGPLG